MNKWLPVIAFSVLLLVPVGTQNAFALPGDFVGVFASGGGLVTPRNLVFGPDENLYVASTDSAQILLYDGSNGDFLDVFAENPAMEIPQGLAFSPNGDALYVTSGINLHQILKFDGTTGDFIEVFATLAPNSAPRDLAFGPDGHLYVANVFTDEVIRFNVANGDPLGVFGQANSLGSGMMSPDSLVFGPDGNLYVTSGTLPLPFPAVQVPKILRFDGTTGETLGLVAVPGDGNALFIDFSVPLTAQFGVSPSGITFGPDGNLYVTEGKFVGQVLSFRGDNGFPTFPNFEFVSGGELDFPDQLAFGPNGNLFVTDPFDDQILMYVGITNLEQYSLSLSCAPEVTELLLNFPFFHRGGNRIDEQVLLSPLTCPPDFNSVVLLSEVPNGIDAGIFAEVNGQPVPSRFCNLDNLDEPPNFNISIDIDPNTGEVFCKKGTSSIATLSLIPDEFTPPPDNGVVGGELLPIETTALLLASAQTFSWMIPVILSGIGIGLFVVSRKSENS